MDWVAISDIVKVLDWGTLANIAVVFSVYFIVRQLKETQRTTQAQTYTTVLSHLQNEEVRRARRVVFRLKWKSPKDWSREEIDAAEIVCHTYDAVGQMVQHEFLSKEMILKNWGYSLRKSWPILSPLIKEYRRRRDACELWDDYERLAKTAIQAYDEAKRKRMAGKDE